jgi:hypothetical protein
MGDDFASAVDIPSDEESAQLEGQRESQRLVHEFVKNRIARIEKVYDYSLTSLWVANAGAAIAILTFIGSTWSNGAFYRPALWPLGLFIAGLISMGVGSLLWLISERGVIRRLERVASLLNIDMQDIHTPSEGAGLWLGNARTTSALISGVLFVSGCVLGFLLLLRG